MKTVTAEESPDMAPIPDSQSQQPCFLGVSACASAVSEQPYVDTSKRISSPGSFLTGLGKWWSSWKHSELPPRRQMVVSSGGTHIAILDRHTITFLTRENGFTEPLGSSTGSMETGYYTCGAWIQGLNAFAATTSHKSIFLMDMAGQVFSKASFKDYKGRGHIIGLFANESSCSGTGERYQLVALTSDCYFHQIEIHSGGFCDTNLRTFIHISIKQMYPQGIVCHDYSADNSILALIGLPSAHRISKFAGKYCISVWKVKEFWKFVDLLGFVDDLEEFHDSSVNVSGTSEYLHPKLVISPDCSSIGVLSSDARLQVLSVSQTPDCSLCKVQFPVGKSDVASKETTAWPLDRSTVWRERDSGHDGNIFFFEVSAESGLPGQQCKGTIENLNDVVGVCWWTKHALAVLKKDGVLSIITAKDFKIMSRCTMGISSDDIGTYQDYSRRHIFLLENATNSVPAGTVGKGGWRLIDLEAYSVTELYKVLLEYAEFESALLVADRYKLSTETIYKARWLRSDYGLHALQQNLPKIEDRLWVLRQCLEKVCPTLEAMNWLLQHGLSLLDNRAVHMEEAAHNPSVGHLCLMRLRLLQYKDRLETYLGLSMGRYNPKDYELLRSTSLLNVALRLAELGKIGALTLLFKRHRYSLASSVFKILDAIPETISPHTYTELLPLCTPPQAVIVGRDRDWVEEGSILEIIEKYDHIDCQKNEVKIQDCTEYLVRLKAPLTRPCEQDIVNWYKTRAEDIDRVSGQVENALSLLDWGKQKGLMGLEDLWQDVSDLHVAVYKNNDFDNADMNLRLKDWLDLNDYDKLRKILSGVNELNVMDRLKEQAIPFMKRRHNRRGPLSDGLTKAYSGDVKEGRSLLVQWMIELAQKNQLQLCAAIFSDVYKNPVGSGLFETDVECIEAGLDCVYSCTRVDQWDLMVSILSNLSLTCLQSKPANSGEQASRGKHVGRMSTGGGSHSDHNKSIQFTELHSLGAPLVKGSIYASLREKIEVALGHVEAGRLLTQYQVPKPISFFESAKDDERLVKQLIHLLLSKFGRRQPPRSDSDWALMWENLQKLHSLAFPFLNRQFLFLEYYRGLLKAGKFYLAKSQLNSLGSGLLSTEKAEAVIIQAAREYFYSASSLESSEIDKARMCLNLLPESKSIATEMALIDAVTLKLPALGVSLLPLQVRQVKDPMDIVRMALNSSSANGHLLVDDVLDVARSLGLTSSDDIAMVEEAIAREAAATGQILLALNLCLGLIKKGHGSIWDLCAALARGPDLEGMTLNSRKDLLGFALSHCDEASVEHLLTTWKETDFLKKCTEMKTALSSKLKSSYDEDQHNNIVCFDNVFGCTSEKNDLPDEQPQNVLTKVAQEETVNVDALNKGNFSKEKRRLLDCLCSQLPWLLPILETEMLEHFTGGDVEDIVEASCLQTINKLFQSCSKKTPQCVAIVFLGLAHCDISPKDELICHVARVAMQRFSEGREGLISCGYLLNLSDYHAGVCLLEQELQEAEKLKKRCQILKLAFKYASLQDATPELTTPKQRRGRLWKTLRNSDATAAPANTERDFKSISSSPFWKDWRCEVSQQLQTVENALELEEVIPGFDMEQFLTGDEGYIKQTVLQLIESAKVMTQEHGLLQSSYVSRYQRPDLVIFNTHANEVKDTKLDIEILEQRYRVFKKYIKYLNIRHRLLAFQTLMYHTCSAILGDKLKASSERISAPTLCCLLNFWITVCKDALDDLDMESGDNGSSQAAQSLQDLKTCCQSFENLVKKNYIEDKEAQQVIVKVASYVKHGDDRMMGFITAMISSGCSFQSVVLFWKNRDQDLEWQFEQPLNSTSTSEVGEIYAQMVTSAVDACCKTACVDDWTDHLENLIKTVSSLGVSLKGHPIFGPLLYEVRVCVWETLCRLAENPDFPAPLRVCLLRLLDAITSGNTQTDASGSFEISIRNFMAPWAEWEVSYFSHERTSSFASIQHTVVALKSTEILTAAWPEIKVKGEDLLSVEAAVLVFYSVADKVEQPEHATLLLGLLGEWANIFGYEHGTEKDLVETAQSRNLPEDDPHDGWGHADDWNNAWDEIGDEVHVETETSAVKESGLHVHTLHTCWKVAFQKLAAFGLIADIICQLDNSDRQNVLLTKEESDELVSSLKDSPVSALQISLLLPYTNTQNLALEFLSSSANKSRDTLDGLSKYRKQTSRKCVPDGCLLVLVLASSHLCTLADEPGFSGLFSLVCAEMATLIQDNGLSSHIVHKTVFPYFVASLVQTSKYAVACALVMQVMRVHPALVTWNAAFVAVERFLSTKAAMLMDDSLDRSIKASELGSLSCVKNSLSHLQKQLKQTMSKALQFFS